MLPLRAPLSSPGISNPPRSNGGGISRLPNSKNNDGASSRGRNGTDDDLGQISPQATAELFTVGLTPGLNKTGRSVTPPFAAKNSDTAPAILLDVSTSVTMLPANIVDNKKTESLKTPSSTVLLDPLPSVAVGGTYPVQNSIKTPHSPIPDVVSPYTRNGGRRIKAEDDNTKGQPGSEKTRSGPKSKVASHPHTLMCGTVWSPMNGFHTFAESPVLPGSPQMTDSTLR